METGKVIWFDQQKGYGFIRKDNGRDLFMHTKVLPYNKDISVGARVEFETSAEYNGQLALRVRVV